MPTALVVRAAGTNCEQELVRAFAMAGATPRLVHIDALLREAALIEDADLIGLPGGFSYGDDIASGRILAMKVRERLYPDLRAAAERGCPIIGVCNGFQVLVQAGLLPGPEEGERWPDSAPTPTIALTDNARARFIDDWVAVEAAPDSPCVWTAPLADRALGPAAAEIMRLPIAHGEGRFVARDEALLRRLAERGQIALRYRDNPNGSQDAVAGICDATGRIFGLMPHPERYLEWNRHPWWTRLPESSRRGQTPGLAMFRAAVESVAGVRA